MADGGSGAAPEHALDFGAVRTICLVGGAVDSGALGGRRPEDGSDPVEGATTGEDMQGPWSKGRDVGGRESPFQQVAALVVQVSCDHDRCGLRGEVVGALPERERELKVGSTGRVPSSENPQRDGQTPWRRDCAPTGTMSLLLVNGEVSADLRGCRGTWPDSLGTCVEILDHQATPRRLRTAREVVYGSRSSPRSTREENGGRGDHVSRLLAPQLILPRLPAPPFVVLHHHVIGSRRITEELDTHRGG
mmetsp:Transcript_22610/g.70761  ORF Transcript_22610/g.70761 Transcript_22610/m.70761 type:complete len:248 (+) Transcript_22610:61-804(+)